MSLIAATLGVVIGVPIYDYLSVTGAAAKITSVEYQYWPPSILRWIAIAILAGGVLVTFFIMNPPEPDGRIWVILPAFFGLIFHGCVSITDVLRQRHVAATDPDDS